MTAAASYRAVHAATPISTPALTAFQAAMISVVAFCLTAMNGVPLVWSSLPPVVAISGLLMLQRDPKVMFGHAFSGPMLPFSLMFVAYAILTVTSAFVSGETDSINEALLRTVAPLVPFLALAGVKIRARHIEWIIGGFVAGTALLIFRATLAFYSEWGVPDLSTMLWARYNVIRMSGYMAVTLGNLSHMGLYLTLLTPFFIAVLAYFKVSRPLIIAIAILLVLSLLNAVISGSRTAIVLIIPLTALIFARRGPGALLVLMGILAVLAVMGAIYGLDPVSQTDLINRFVPSEGATGFDASAVERVDSIYLGWDVFKEHPIFGIGPGMAYRYIPYGIPHESVVHMLLELGVFGGTLFLAISLAMIASAARAILAPDPDGSLHWRAAWLIGPASYFLFGILGGIAFTMSMALVWIGVVYTMVSLAHARIVCDDAL